MLTERQEIIALSVAAKEAGVSYGKLAGLLSRSQQDAIYKEYAETQLGRKGRANIREGSAEEIR